MFLGGAVVFILSIKRGSVFVNFYSLSMLFFSLILFVLWSREIVVSGREEADYFLSSLMLALSYFLIILSVNFEAKNFTNMLSLLWLSLVMQSLIILARFFGVFEVPVPFGVSDVNRGIVSLQVREQVTSTSLALQVCSVFILSKRVKDKAISFFIALLVLPAVLIAGSMLALMVFSAVIAVLSYDLARNSTLLTKLTSATLALFLVFLFIPLFLDNVQQYYEESGMNKDQAVDLIKKADDGDAFIDKLINRNTRTKLLAESIGFTVKDTISILLGDTKKNFMDFTGGFSPHSIISETISLGGALGFIMLLLFLYVLYYRSKLSFSKNLVIIYFALMMLTGTINSVNMGLPIFGLMLVLLRPTADRLSVKSASACTK